MQTIAPLYETDFYAWTQEQAALLRAEELEKLDLANLIEEIEAMGRRDRRELSSRLIVLLMHLLKWQYQPTLHGHAQPSSWLRTIHTQRRKLELLLLDSPSLRRELPDHLEYAWPRACADASRETGLSLVTFPATCPYTMEQILDATYLPAA